MYIQDKEEWEYHRKTFGEHTKFGYKDFIQMFQAEKFDSKQWARLFKEAGAKYVFPVAEHHDGFQMYKSEISKYNAFDMGPKRDLLGELREAIEEENLMFGSGIVEVERGALADPKPFVWQTDTAIAKNSWCYTDTLEYKTSRQIICNFIEIISKNGNMLLNVGPKGDGEIPEEDQRILREIGMWMEKNESAVFGSKPWRKAAEGSVRVSEGQFTDNEELPYTKEDIRFTANGDSIYAFVMRYPKDGDVTIRSLAESEDQNVPNFHGLIQEVSVLGFDAEVTYEKDTEGLHIHTEGVDTEYPVVIRIRVN